MNYSPKHIMAARRPGCRSPLRRELAVGAVLFLALTAAAAQEPETPSERPVEVLRARLVAAPPGHRAIGEVRLFLAGGGRVDWSPQGDWIAYDQAGPDGLYDVYLRTFAGSAATATCLTCELDELRRASAFSPAWHPSGDYLAIQVQSKARRLDLDLRQLATPFRGLHSELWIVTRDGRDGWQVTRTGERGGAVLDPHFSHEGGLVAWSERLTNREPPWGEWGVRVAELTLRRGAPRLGKVRTYDLGQGLVIAHGFSPDDRGVLIAATPGAGLPEASMDLLRLDLGSGEFERLTTSPDQRDDVVASVPDRDDLVWATDRNLAPATTRLPRRSDLWLRSASGRRQERLTFFNDPASDHYLGAALIDDLAWSPDGKRLLLHVVSAPDEPPGAELTEALYLVTLRQEFPR